ncbi:3-deoxy-7-phosphoheptulonate synthase [Fodinisporobacter ferrooxydans]|uniref:3-deoxy-7-phosphoheptulonate synthase n=1 Tax=Fodinisporobacter ferrooxydans TaxID=2901836 RepID=A0ABY4CMP4_9BACL|nr:3-deoxy-7-phosphoheptulonate synthase [Alicyclobacillaceae bacterium MYW30-H2]
MVIVMQKTARAEEIQKIVDTIEALQLRVHISEGTERTIVGIIGNKSVLTDIPLESFDGVEKIVHVTHPFKMASREFHPEPTIIEVGNVRIGAGTPVIMAGPCAVESREQILQTAHAVKAAGATCLRGGAFKPRSSPYSFQGLKEEGLKLLAEARKETGLAIVTEVMDPVNLPMVAEYADILQIGARNMQNFHLLKEVGKTGKPVMLKRGIAATIEEWLMSAEYILSEGNPNVMLCERGIRTFEKYTRNTMDLNAIPVIKHLSHLPVIADPSHGTGVARYVPAMSKASIAAGADGLILEVHPNPAKAMSDGPQSLTLEQFDQLMKELGNR